MMDFLLSGPMLGFYTGLGAGWLLFKQPEWVRDLAHSVWTWIRLKIGG